MADGLDADLLFDPGSFDDSAAEMDGARSAVDAAAGGAAAVHSQATAALAGSPLTEPAAEVLNRPR